MLHEALLIFAITAAGGIVLGNGLVRGWLASRMVSLLHAAFALCGLLLLLGGTLQAQWNAYALLALWVLCLATGAGFHLTLRRARQPGGPPRMAWLHVMLALAGLGTLLVAVQTSASTF
ncbi:hypothetical protein [Elongatibacter sediminis]|uniref:Uncharacterized protein n=1 Tax=Elongatibacter sediminis TaxID=3119006 RepID=A0AAW9REX2_9GAMM